jgi:hypothetical protein
MRRLLPLALASLALTAQADTLRCGSRLVSLGDRAFEVLENCGEPRLREPLGYTLGGYDRRELRIEEWVYGPQSGMYSILTFEGGRLVRIERRRRD